VDQLLYETYFRDLTGGTFIEAGAHDGLSLSSCRFFEEFLGWRGCNIEPIAPLYEQLCVNRPAATNVHAALSSASGRATLRTRHDNSFGGTLRSVEGRAEFRQTMPDVRTLTYEELIREQGLTKVDLFVLDVEGHELEVLKGMQGARVLPDVMVVEHSLVPVEDIAAHLEPWEYRLDFRHRVNSFFSRPE
jgi:FkbM family methyltransferase